MVLTAPDPKVMTRSLRAELQARNLELTHSQCLEIVARQFGFDNWNVLAAKLSDERADLKPATAAPWGASNTTIPVLRIFAVEQAEQFYVDFLGFTLDFGGPSGGEGTPFYGQVSRAATTLHLSEHRYDPGPGSTVLVWMNGVDDLRHELNVRREQVRVWGPAVWVPEVEMAPWGARVLTLADPFGNHMHFNEPEDEAVRAHLPRWQDAHARSPAGG